VTPLEDDLDDLPLVNDRQRPAQSLARRRFETAAARRARSNGEIDQEMLAADEMVLVRDDLIKNSPAPTDPVP
jgi:hypothetical protein